MAQKLKLGMNDVGETSEDPGPPFLAWSPELLSSFGA